MNKIVTISNERIGSSYVHVKHKSGLDIYIWKMEGFSTKHAYFATKYGSINTHFKTKNTEGCVDVPEGIAHFLEHKLFENEDCDVFELYAKTGASGNAYTSFDHTCYLFECSDNFEESLAILLSFVQKPHFTPESVAKEQGIIGQEIKMCEDNPDRQVFYNMLKALYVNHPIKIDIAGTVESIAQIDDKLLYECYNTFYNLHNMVLSIAGDVDVDKILEICDNELIECEDNQLETFFPEEPLEVCQKEIYQKLPVGIPIFSIGFKAKPYDVKELSKVSMVASIMLSAAFGSASDFYKKLLDEQLINSSFGSSVFYGEGHCTTYFAGDSQQPKVVYQRILDEIERIKTEGIDRNQFEIIKKGLYGRIVREYNSVEQNTNKMMAAHFSGGDDAFEVVEILAGVTYEDVMNSVFELLNPEYSVISVIDNK